PAGRSSTRASPGACELSCISDTYAVPPAQARPTATNATVGPNDITEDPPPTLSSHPACRQVCDKFSVTMWRRHRSGCGLRRELLLISLILQTNLLWAGA